VCNQCCRAHARVGSKCQVWVMRGLSEHAQWVFPGIQRRVSANIACALFARLYILVYLDCHCRWCPPRPRPRAIREGNAYPCAEELRHRRGTLLVTRSDGQSRPVDVNYQLVHLRPRLTLTCRDIVSVVSVVSVLPQIIR